jgi:hypothetical protein
VQTPCRAGQQLRRHCHVGRQLRASHRHCLNSIFEKEKCHEFPSCVLVSDMCFNWL